MDNLKRSFSGLTSFRPMPDRVTDYLFQQAKIVEIDKNEEDVCSHWSKGSERAFLLQGVLRVLSAEGGEYNIVAGLAEHGSEVPYLAKKHGRVVPLKPAVLAVIPNGLFKSINGVWGRNSCAGGYGIELTDGGVENELYMAFSEHIRSGGYELPSIPDIALKVRAAIENRDMGFLEVSKIIQADHSLTAQVIKIANISAFNNGFKIDSCRGAVTHLGMQTTQNLVVSFVLKRLFISDVGPIKKEMERLWAHSRKVAAICYVMSGLCPNIDPEKAMLSGLIHDIGAIPVLQAASSNSELLSSPTLLRNTMEALKREFGIMILREWKFPRPFEDSILEGENWLRSKKGPPDYTDLVIAAKLHAYIGESGVYSMPPPDLAPAYGKIASNQAGCELSIRILEGAHKELRQVEKLLDGK